ncbi:MAG TPA: RND transporter [Clostridiales bacterium]|nr:RND transporter [Clostridiales bacterium]
MDKFAYYITHHKKRIIVLFVAAAIVCAILTMFVGVNYNMADYLPEEAQSTQALQIMREEFEAGMPNTNVLVKDVSITDALSYKESLAAIEGVTDVMWLDDMVDIVQPLETMEQGTVEGFYKNGNALFSVTISEGMEKSAVDEIWALIGDENAVTGEAADVAAMQQATGAEVSNALLILLPVVLAILIFSSSSWIDPLLYIIAIGISILINMGTNVFFGEISFMTNSVSPILQLAVSLDYAIFLLHSFSANRKKYATAEQAMQQAVKESVSTVFASALTTLFGFLALTLMDFQIGADLGWALAKGIILSFISSIVFLPAFTLVMVKAIDKTRHRPLLPSFKNVNRFFSKLAIPALILVAIIIVPSFLGQGQTGFIYGGSSASGTESRSSRSREEMREAFGQSTVMAVLVPRGDIAKEAMLTKDLEQLPHVTGVMSYAGTVGTAFPAEFIGEDVTGQFYSENYARIIAYTDTPDEGDLAFATVEEITAVAQSYYGEDVYSVGQSANLYDMKNVVERDNQFVTIIAIIAIFLVLLFTFRSGTLPFILLLTIETGIWVNLAIPYFSGESINFIGYLVLNTVQLGATVDYAILLTTAYMRKRKLMPQKQAMHEAMGENFKSILISAGTLATAGFTLYATSSNPAVADIGLLLGRGTVLSGIMVLCFLPGMLRLFDKVIAKTTYKSEFLTEYKEKKRIGEKEAQNEI